MERPIIAFGHDSAGEPIAVLSCGHPQHVRHNPPFINRPWVTSEEGRNGMIGQMLNSVRCENIELPARWTSMWNCRPTMAGLSYPRYCTASNLWVRSGSSLSSTGPRTKVWLQRQHRPPRQFKLHQAARGSASIFYLSASQFRLAHGSSHASEVAIATAEPGLKLESIMDV